MAALCFQMVKEREDDLVNVENEHKVVSVQDRFPNDDLQLTNNDKENKQMVSKHINSK